MLLITLQILLRFKDSKKETKTKTKTKKKLCSYTLFGVVQNILLANEYFIMYLTVFLIVSIKLDQGLFENRGFNSGFFGLQSFFASLDKLYSY